jgi:hypothetical protein
MSPRRRGCGRQPRCLARRALQPRVGQQLSLRPRCQLGTRCDCRPPAGVKATRQARHPKRTRQPAPFRDAYLDVFDGAEPRDEIDPEACSVRCFDLAERRSQHVGRHSRSAQHSHPPGLAHRSHEGCGSNESHASVDERNLQSVLLGDACLQRRILPRAELSRFGLSGPLASWIARGEGAINSIVSD